MHLILSYGASRAYPRDDNNDAIELLDHQASVALIMPWRF
jgi:hypothetical protein